MGLACPADLKTVPLDHRLPSCRVARMTSAARSSAGGASFRFCGVPCPGHTADPTPSGRPGRAVPFSLTARRQSGGQMIPIQRQGARAVPTPEAADVVLASACHLGWAAACWAA